MLFYKSEFLNLSGLKEHFFGKKELSQKKVVNHHAV